MTITKTVPTQVNLVNLVNLESQDTPPTGEEGAEFASLGGNGVRRFSMLAYSGGMAHQAWDPTVIDLSGLEVPETAPALRQHDATRFVGRIDNHTNDGLELRLGGFLFTGVVEADEVLSIAQQGGEWQASVGIGWSSSEDLEWISEGQTRTVNGRQFSGPFLLIKKSTLRECSFVPLGADPATSAVALASETREITFSSKEAETMATPTPADPLKEERERVSAIQKQFSDDPHFAIKAIGEGWTPVEAKAEYADKLSDQLEAQKKAADEERERLAKELEEAKKAPVNSAATSISVSSGAPTHVVADLSDDPIERWHQEIDRETARLRDAGHRGFALGLSLDKDFALRQQAAFNVRANHPEIALAYREAATANDPRTMRGKK